MRCDVSEKPLTLDEAIAHAEEVAGNLDTPCKREHMQLAEWLKELRDRRANAVGNEAALRETLQKLRDRFMHDAIAYQDRVFIYNDRHWAKKSKEAGIWRDVFFDLQQECESALKKPPRNCDVGTVDDQVERFDAECKGIRSRNTVEPCAGCPISEHGEGTEDCQLRWANLPYLEG